MSEPLARLDRDAFQRELARSAGGERLQLYAEQLFGCELADPPGEPGVRVWAEEGFSLDWGESARAGAGAGVRLASLGRDGLDLGTLRDALRQLARSPRGAAEDARTAPLAALAIGDASDQLRDLLTRLRGALRAATRRPDLRLVARLERRDVVLLTARGASPAQQEQVVSLRLEQPGVCHGELLAGWPEVDLEPVVARFAARLALAAAPPPPATVPAVVLGPAAAAVLVHEAVGHLCEADTMAMAQLAGFDPASILAPPGLAVRDDPRRGPVGCQRNVDDEGEATGERRLLADGRIAGLLADRCAAGRDGRLLAGSGWRGGRHQPVLPRLRHLAVDAGDVAMTELLAAGEDGIYVPLVERGELDPVSGRCVLALPGAYRIAGGRPGQPCGPAVLSGAVGELLAAIRDLGNAVELIGGWCAKGGQRMAVWTEVPALLLGPVALAARGER